ncbi:MAG: tetratricopeptide repeat protein [Bacteroidales bacterium]|nr:tetratricopeptide repeat protein [Bacteroidales bacterium]
MYIPIDRLRTTLAALTVVPVILLFVMLCGCSSGKPASSRQANAKERAAVARSETQIKTDALMIQGKMLLETGREEEALKVFRRILKSDSGYGAALFETSRIMAEAGLADSAIFYAEKAANTEPENVWYQLNLAILYRYTNNKAQSIATWEKIVSQNPEVLDYYYELSNAYLLDNNIKKAISTLNRVEERVGITEVVSLQKSKLWSYAGKEDKAMEEIEALANAMPNETKYSAMLAGNYMNSKNYAKAKQYYDRVLASDPNNEYIHIALAEYYKATNQPGKAYEEMRIGLAHPSLNTANKIQLLTNFYNNGEFYGIYSEYAYSLLSDIMQNCDDSTSFTAFAFYGDVLMRQKKFDEAASQFRIALNADSTHYDIWEALLVAEMQSGTDTAQTTLDAMRASRLFPLHPLPYFVQAVAAHDRGDFASAVELAHKCELMGFDKGYLEAETYNLLAVCYSRLDDERCEAYFDKYLALQPNDNMALNSYAYYLAQKGRNLEKAERMSKRTITDEPDNPHYLDTYAWILHLRGNDSEAAKYIRRAMKNGGETSDEIKEHYRIILNQ